MLTKVFYLVCICIGMQLAAEQNADFIIFSYNRPLQLYALLESTTAYISGLQDIFVIYRSSDEAFEQGYQIVQDVFRKVHFLKQTIEPHNNFKELTLNAFHTGCCDYVLFGVDDIVVKDMVDISQAIVSMQQNDAYGCYLRLSPEIDYLYSWQRSQEVPYLRRVDAGYLWRFNDASAISDWGYPHTVDMTIYKKADIAKELEKLNYHNPNTMEAAWSKVADKIRGRYGFCFAASKIVNLPLNLVQTSYTSNPHMKVSELLPEELLHIFLSGKKMDIAPLFQVKNRSPHMEYLPTYRER